MPKPEKVPVNPPSTVTSRALSTRAITVELPADVARDCADVAMQTGRSEMEVREVVRKAAEAKLASLPDAASLFAAHLEAQVKALRARVDLGPAPNTASLTSLDKIS